MTTLAEGLLQATDYLFSAGLEFPRDDAELILATVTESSRTCLISHPEQALTSQQELVLWRWLEKRAEHYPIQYMRGCQEFYGREFLVSREVLVPRPETELLIDVSLSLLEGRRPLRILDIGTGSGCIAITLLLEKASLSAVATDIMPAALTVARANAARRNCGHRLTLLQGDVAQPLEDQRVKFDLIVSNPPYVALSEKESVAKAVAEYEPGVALYGGETGLDLFEKIFTQASRLLASNGHLVLELGPAQQAAVVDLGQAFGWIKHALRKDLVGMDRCLVFRQES
jgi:release factor glutamine methyltransferase